MSRAFVCAVLFAQMLLLTMGCSDDTKYQFGIRGKWRLESRKLPDGKELRPPAVTGLYEWFPIGQHRAHVTASFSASEHQIQLTESIYTLNEQTFTREERLRIGGGYGLTHQPTYTTPDTTFQGRIAVDGNRTTFIHADGRQQIYENITLAVTKDTYMKIIYSDHTVDTWKRITDQVGVLAK